MIRRAGKTIRLSRINCDDWGHWLFAEADTRWERVILWLRGYQWHPTPIGDAMVKRFDRVS